MTDSQRITVCAFVLVKAAIIASQNSGDVALQNTLNLILPKVQAEFDLVKDAIQ